MDRGKRLSRGNVIGKQGELAFAQWALDHQLSANKADTDVGVDFFCQVMAPVANSESIEGAGSILGAQVKAVDDEDKPRLNKPLYHSLAIKVRQSSECLLAKSCP
jgi:hypothetical protein